MGVGVGTAQDTVCGVPRRIALLIGLITSWILFFVFFIFGILLIVGVFGNAHPKVIEIMNCGTPGSSVSCARVYGYRAEGVVLIILAFFFLAWGSVFTAAYFISGRRAPSQPLTKGGLALRPMRSHTAHFATSEA